MNPIRSTFIFSVGLVCVVLLSLPAARDLPAQDSPAKYGPATSKAAPAAGAAEQPGGLNESEASLSRRYKQFERTLLQMAEYLRKTEPERADLLIRAIGKSKEDRVSLQMDQIMDLLKNEQLGDAIGREEHLVSNLRSLLELLQSEDRRHQLEEEKKYLESVHQEINKLSNRQKELKRATERGGQLDRLADRQSKIGNDTHSLLQKIEKQDAARKGANPKEGSEQAEKSPGEKNGKEGSEKENGDSPKGGKSKSDKSKGDKQNDKQRDGNKPDGNKPDSDKQNAEKQKSDKDKPAGSPDSKDGQKSKGDKQSSKGKSGQKQQDAKKKDGKQNDGSQKPEESDSVYGENSHENQSSEQQESERQQAQKRTPGREQIEQARRAMQQAEDELKRLQGTKAVEKQDEAIRKLADAKERLEKILRQLREEEQEIMLTSLEARFAKMLLMEIQLHLDTVTLAKTAKNAWTPKHFGKARDLSVLQETVADEAYRALNLLKEEGSSVAFPKGVEQVRDDMLTISHRLGKYDVGELTQSIEKDVIESLQELVASLQSEIENRKKPENQRRRQQKGGEQGEQDRQLVEQLAELKMLRSLQLRVNRRTKTIGRMITGEQATSDDLTTELQSLARKQAEIQEATYILASGRNQ
jgi:hypothetical protein